MFIYLGIHITAIKEKEVLILKERGQGWGVHGRVWKEVKYHCRKDQSLAAHNLRGSHGIDKLITQLDFSI